jgi:type IV secretory pathway TrbD component
MDSTDNPREIVIHQAANRPNLLLGGDRELVTGDDYDRRRYGV